MTLFECLYYLLIGQVVCSVVITYKLCYSYLSSGHLVLLCGKS